MINTELEHVSDLLDKVTARQAERVAKGELKYGDSVKAGTDLVYTLAFFQRRAIAVPGRRLIPEYTTQPVLATKEGTPIVYAEDVISHPLRRNLEQSLEALSVG